MTTSDILMVVFTAVIAVTGVIGAIIFNNQLSVMQGQLREMQADRRPWISIEAVGHTGISWEDRGARLSVTFKLKNVGKSPARNVFFEAKAILPRIGEPAIPIRAMSEYAADIQRRRARGEIAGEVFFPDETYLFGMQMLIDRDEATRLVHKSNMLTVLPRIIACASYDIGSDPLLRSTCASYYVMIRGTHVAPGLFEGLAIDQNVTTEQVDIGTAFYSLAD